MTLDNIYNYLEKHKSEIGQVKFSKLRTNYFQISLIDENTSYKLLDIHFEIRSKKDDYFSLEIHFEEYDTTRYKLSSALNKLVDNSDFEWFQWWTGKKVKRNANNQSLKSKKSYFVDGEKSLEEFFSVIKKEHDRFNSTLVQIAKEKQKYTMDKGKNNQMLSIKNIILYGSPGVGKTHNTNKLIMLIEKGKNEKEIFKEIKENKKETIELDEDIKSRTKFVTFHQSFGYEDFIEGFRPNEEGKIELVDGIFKNICKEAQDNLDNSQSDKVFNFDRFLSDFIQEVEAKEMFQIDTNLTIKVKKKTNGDFQSFKVGGRVKNQSLTKDIIKRDFELFLNRKITIYQDIQPTFESQSQYHGNAPYYFKLYEAMKEYLDTTDFKYESNKSDLQNYYLVIDEINRGNISKIFGELITLIEEDKRDKLEVTLPYSKQPFKIPSNLYIIGTMNSSDKSIALIDIALRRRFTFLKMKPNADLIDDNEAKALFIALNEHIKKSHLGEDYQIGHSYFMGIESPDDLDFVWEYKIKPLLEEYFYGDKEGLDEVLKLKS